MLLGINVDHVATLRQARQTTYPDPVQAARIAERAGADSITLHLREDRRHIQDDDVRHLQQSIGIPVNLELAITDEMLSFACACAPEYCCLVPEKREELTTEGGLDLVARQAQIAEACARLSGAGIRVSLFIDATPAQVETAATIGAPGVELHTGHYAEAAAGSAQQRDELEKLATAATLGRQLGRLVHAGHGLHYENVAEIARIDGISELNIGHSIISKAVFTGLHEAVQEMKRLTRHQGA